MVGCSENEYFEDSVRKVTISAELENSDATRSLALDGGGFAWSVGDAIGVYTTSGKFREFTLENGGGGSSANFTGLYIGSEKSTTCAAYPYNANHTVSGNALNFHMPNSYGSFNDEYVPNTNAPMVARFDTEGSESFSFRHIGGVFKFTFNNVPVDVAQFVFTATDKDITGDFAVDLTSSENPSIDAKELSTANSVAINFKPLTEVKNGMVVYVPLPTGTYNGFTLSMHKQDGTKLVSFKSTATNILARCDLKKFPELTFADVSGSIEADPKIFSASTTAVEPQKDTDGTYLIANAANLKWFMENGESSSNSFKLTTDIIMETDWKSVGSFHGTFDGNNHKILNLKASLYANDDKGIYYFAGFFSFLSDATVKNLIFESPQVYQGYDYSYYSTEIGVLASEVSGNTKILNCGVIGGKSYGNSSSLRPYIGGMIGTIDCNSYASVLIKGCFINGVTVEDTNLTSSKAIVGGLVGNFDDDSYNISIISCYTKDITLVGNVKGSLIGSFGFSYNCLVSTCYYDNNAGIAMIGSGSYNNEGYDYNNTITACEALTDANFATAISNMNANLTDCDYIFAADGTFVKRQ